MKSFFRQWRQVDPTDDGGQFQDRANPIEQLFSIQVKAEANS
jgi:hypothetical protein